MVTLTSDQIETYRRDGVVVLRGLIPPQTLANIEEAVSTNLDSPSSWSNDYTPEGSGGRFFDDYVN